MKKRLTTTLALVTACCAVRALAQSPVVAENDIVIGMSEASLNYKFYDASAGVWSNPTADAVNQQNYIFGSTGFGPNFTQAMEFDNAGGVFGLPTGNLLTMNFGNAFTGAEIYNMATDGSAEWSSLWSFEYETGGAQTTRGNGLSINPSGTKVAWMNYDGYSSPNGHATGSQIWVLDYIRGANPGKGLGIVRPATGVGEADIRGPRITADRPGVGTAGKAGSTQGTTWLSDDVVLGFNGFGEIIAFNTAGVAAGQDRTPRTGVATSFMVPTTSPNWSVVNAQVSFSAQYTSIEYNPAIDPYKVFAAVTRDGGTNFASTLYCFQYNGDPANPVLTLIKTLQLRPTYPLQEPREIAFDKAGNLFWSNYAGSGSDLICGKLNGAYDIDNWVGSNLVAFYVSPDYTGYNGMDVATNLRDTCDGDVNRDGAVDDSDFSVLLSNWGTGNSWFEGDLTGDLTVDDADFSILLANWGSCN